jgi:CheY-like chemotaxis protein
MPHRLLLADDSVTIQRVIELTFADEDIEVIAVGDGREAIRRIEADRPDIVLADVGMPELDGYEVAAYVKNTPHLSHIPVLLLTGAFEPVDEQRAREVGCDGVLAKPFEPQMVITRVNELLDAAPPPRAATAPPVVVDRRVEPLPPPAVGPVFDAPPIAVPAATLLQAPPLSPLDAFLAATPALDLAAYGARSNASEWSHQAVPDLRPSVEREPNAGLADVPLATDSPFAAPEREVLAADPSTIRISRRTPIAVPGFGAPALPLPSSSAAELDDYFEKLDAAFASMQQTPLKPEPLDPSAAPAGGPAPSSHATEPLPASGRWLSPPVEPPVGVSGTESQAVEHAPAIAQAFSALLAAEHGQAAPVTAPTTLSPDAIDGLVERVASEVVERMSDRVVRDMVTDIVSRIAEKLVREEIDRVKATIK